MSETLHTYEILVTEKDGVLDRLRVAGGWLYRTRTWHDRSQHAFGTALAFVPDATTPATAQAPPAE